MIPNPFSRHAPHPLASKLCRWLDATTSYSNELKDNLHRKPNHERTAPKWRLFYQHGPVLISDQRSLMDADGNPTRLQLAIKTVAYDRSVSVGEIITSGNGRKYIVQPNGSIRKCD